MKRTETHTAALGGDAREAPRSPAKPRSSRARAQRSGEGETKQTLGLREAWRTRFGV